MLSEDIFPSPNFFSSELFEGLTSVQVWVSTRAVAVNSEVGVYRAGNTQPASSTSLRTGHIACQSVSWVAAGLQQPVAAGDPLPPPHPLTDDGLA